MEVLLVLARGYRIERAKAYETGDAALIAEKQSKLTEKLSEYA